MKREIKFIAFDPIEKTFYKVAGWNFESEEVRIENEIYDLWVDTDDVILLQFTGLYDKNGKEIYEGDIVDEYNENIVCETRIGIGYICITGKYGVSIKKENATYGLINYAFDGDFDRGKLTNIQIIGNIYENPELLKFKH